MKDIRNQFPILTSNPYLVYLDSTATALKPASVMQKEMEYYQSYSANIHRGIYPIAEKATAEYEATRTAVGELINAATSDEVIFTRGTTEALNLIASTWGADTIQNGDVIVTTIMEHHSNFVPWQQLALRNHAELRVIPVSEKGYLDIVEDDGLTVNSQKLSTYITPETKLFAFTAVSNTLGTINPVAEIIAAVKKIAPSCIVVVDAAQALPHMQVNVQHWGADVIAFSAHKLFGPTGVGVLWAKKTVLETIRPYQYGGEMVLDVSIENTTFKQLPHRLEAGTPNIAGVIGLGEAIRFIHAVGYQTIQEHEQALAARCMVRLAETLGEDVRILGPVDPARRAGIISFVVKGYHAHDIAQILGEQQICVRAGHHCTMPLHKALHVQSSTRASFQIYNTEEDIESLMKGLLQIKEILG